MMLGYANDVLSSPMVTSDVRLGRSIHSTLTEWKLFIVNLHILNMPLEKVNAFQPRVIVRNCGKSICDKESQSTPSKVTLWQFKKPCRQGWC